LECLQGALVVYTAGLGAVCSRAGARHAWTWRLAASGQRDHEPDRHAHRSVLRGARARAYHIGRPFHGRQYCPRAGAGAPRSGWSAFKELWWSTLLALEPCARALAPDMPGHGGSPLQGSVTMSLIATRIAQFCAARGLERITLVGHSMGGNIALELALARPDLDGVPSRSSGGLHCWPWSRVLARWRPTCLDMAARRFRAA